MNYYLITHPKTSQIFMGRAAGPAEMRIHMTEFCRKNALDTDFELIAQGCTPAELVSGDEGKAYWDRFLSAGNFPIINVTHRI